MFLSIVICVQYLLFILNSTESGFMDIVIMKFWYDTDCIRVDQFGPHPAAQLIFQTYSWNVAGRRSSSKLQDYLDFINVNNTDLINSWYVRSMDSTKNYFVDLYYENREWKRLHWVFLIQSNKKKLNFMPNLNFEFEEDTMFVKLQTERFRDTGYVHSVNLNRTKYIKANQELLRAMFEERNSIKNDWVDFNCWLEQLWLSSRNSREYMTIINETNRRVQKQLRQWVNDEETNQRSIIVLNETLHMNEMLLQNHKIIIDLQKDYRNKRLKFLIIIGCIVFILAILIIIIQCIRRFKFVNSKELVGETMKNTFESK
eukprot:187359_1